MIQKLLREPLLHFVVFGGLVFGIHTLVGAGDTDAITITASEQDRLAELWAGEAGRAPTEQELDGAIAAYAEEEALYREALKLGLDDGDTIIRRRMAQKLRFTIEDRNKPVEPSDAELEVFFQKNANRFATSTAVSFSHVFVSPESGSTPVEQRAAKLLSRLKSGSDWRTLGDPFILQRSYGTIGQDQLGRLFGPEFATGVFAADESDAWQGPFPSAYGLHLVRIEEVTAGNSPALVDVRGDVVEAWKGNDQREANGRAVREVVENYQITIEPRS